MLRSNRLTPYSLHLTQLLSMRHLLTTGAVLALAAGTLGAQDAPTAALAERLAGLSAVTGYEQAFGDTLLAILPGAKRDRAGNIVLTLGSGEPRRLAVCPMDEPGYVIGGIRDDGYLTLRRVGRSASPRFDQYFEGQRVTLFGRRGTVPGVVGVRSIHLTRGRSAASQAFTFDDAIVDVGAMSRADVEGLGIQILTPVTLSKHVIRYGDGRLAAPSAGRRAACAALITAARDGKPVKGTVVVAFVVEQELSLRGLRSAAALHGPFSATSIADAGSATVPAAPAFGELSRWELSVRYANTPAETVSLSDLDQVRQKIVSWIGGAQ